MRESLIRFGFLCGLLIGIGHAAGQSKDGDNRIFNPNALGEVTQRVKEENASDAGLEHFFSLDDVSPWWEGPNICVKTAEVEGSDVAATDGSANLAGCIASESSYDCIKKVQTNGENKTIVVTRHCCHGFIRRTDGPGCIAEDNHETHHRSKRRTENVYYHFPSNIRICLPQGRRNPNANSVRALIRRASNLPLGIPLREFQLSRLSRSGVNVSMNFQYDGVEYVGSRRVSFTNIRAGC